MTDVTLLVPSVTNSFFCLLVMISVCTLKHACAAPSTGMVLLCAETT